MSDKRDFEGFKKLVKKNLGDEVGFGTVNVDHWDTQIFALNSALGGGIPAGRTSLLVGPESAGKSTIAAKLASTVSNTNWETGELFTGDYDEKCAVLYVDMEGTLDRDWCKAHNYIPNCLGDDITVNEVAKTDTGNQAVDVINAAIQSMNYSLIILDSVDACEPASTLEKSADDFVMGKKAIMMNRAFRQWQSALNATSRESEHWWQRPTLLCINQLRDSLSMYGGPEYPGGKGQRQYASVILQMSPPKYKQQASKEFGLGSYGGVVKKNKTYMPRIKFSYDMATKDLLDLNLTLGDVDNSLAVRAAIKATPPLWEKTKKGWALFDYTLPKQDDYIDKMRAEPEFLADIMKKVVEARKK